ncbi:MAG TPA: single-stranded-DNA-specific exonuclease RecJ [Candidatus Merdivicinus intestinigallinarum]|nr:single-stranded-DNA-specific exonuclease RecJ [Candidatus Merdivicinus intestinigallinarum]
MLFSKWIYPSFDPRDSAALQREYGISAIVADILAARGIGSAEAAELFDGQDELEDPFLLPDMEKAVSRLEQAINNQEKITIYGDYDCDGVTATVILYLYLQSMGAKVDWYIPERVEEGYGLNCGALDEISARGTVLLVTVDNGIAAVKEVDYAQSLGMDVIVTDHHQVGEELPRAVAVVNPHRKDYQGGFRPLCGAGVAFKLAAAMEGGDYSLVVDSFGALAAIATVGDIVPLTGENRLLAEQGLKLAEYSDLPGLQALMEVAGLKGKPLTSQKAAFGLVPRINAAGRMGSARLAMQLLLSETPEEAESLAQELNQHNLDRQQEELEILSRVEQTLEEHPEILLDRVMVVPAEGLNHGVVGIVSAKLVSLYGKPNIILSVDGDTATGSARSVENFSMFRAISACGGLLEKYGGHSMAAGLTLKTENIPEFTRQINRYAEQYFEKMPVVSQRIDKELHIGNINLNDVSSLQLLEPFGEGNPQPLFLLRGCLIQEIISLGGGKHLKLRVIFEGKPIYVLYFKMTPEEFVFPVGSQVDILANLELNAFRDNVSVAVRLKDIRPTGFNGQKFRNAYHYYQKIRREEAVETKIMAISVPTLEELRWLYKVLRNRGGSSIHVDLFFLAEVSAKMNYCKYRLILDIFQELELIRLPADFSAIYMEETGKVNLENSEILTWLRQHN